MEKVLQGLLDMMLRRGASDLHLVTDQPVFLRIHGDLVPVPDTGYTSDDILAFIKTSMLPLGEDKFQKFVETGDADYSYVTPDKLHRFRFNAYKERGSYCLAIRHIISTPPDYRAIGLPKDVPDVLSVLNGLILVVGPAGSGKTTSLASMVNWLNENRRLHIITVEDPIEYHHTSKRSLVSQREVGFDTVSFETALKQALRQDPDVIVIGEIRDYETMKIAATAAETGHLVLATLHAINAVQALHRIVDLFPPDQQSQIRSQLSSSLRVIYNQRLIPGTTGSRILAVEVLKQSPQVSNLIRRGDIHQIGNFLSKTYGNRSMEDALQELLVMGHVDRATVDEVLRELSVN